MKNKNASIQISISWLFMIIIGTLFLVLAFNIIGKYNEVENAKSDLLLKQTLRTILNHAGRTAGIEENTLIPLWNQRTKKSIFQNKKVEILCENDIPIFSMNGNLDANNEFLRNYPTFMTYIDEKKVGNSYLAVESFRMPFKITNLLAFVSTKNLIIFDSDSKISKKLVYKFKKSYTDLNYKIEKFSDLNINNLKNEIKDNSYSSIVFVSDKGKSPNLNFLNFNIYYEFILINEQGSKGEYGNIILKDKRGNKTYNYVDFDESLAIITMAVFSKKETFDCSYNQLIKSIVPIYSFYINKTSYFEDLSLSKTICPSLSSKEQQKINYGFLKESLIKIKDKIETDKTILNSSNLNLLLNNLNEKLLNLEDFNCPYVY